MKKWIWLGVLLLVATAAAWGFIAKKNNASAEAQKAGQPEKVVRGTLTQSVDSSGRVVANLEVEIKCRASGEVIKLPFDVSQPVKKGELLLELDTVDQERFVLRAEIAMAQSKARLAESQASLKVAEMDVVTSRQRATADLLAAEAKAKEAQLRADRRKQLFEQKLGSAEDYEAADSLYVQATANVETAKAQLEEVKTQDVALETRRQEIALAQAQLDSDRVALEDARQQLQYTKVVSPIDGVVTDRAVQIGAIISSGITNIGGGTSIMTLADLSHVFVLASVDESDIGRVQVGQAVKITVDAYPGETFDGEVQRIATKGVNVSNVVTFEVKIEVTGENRTKLKPEMTANVQIITTKKDDVLMIALTAVWRKDDQTMVTVRDGAGPDRDVPVTLGISDGERAEVLSGLSEGQTVLTRDQMPSRWSNDQPADGQSGGGKQG